MENFNSSTITASKLKVCNSEIQIESLLKSTRSRFQGIQSSGLNLWVVQHRKSMIHGLPLTFHMPKANSNKSYWHSRPQRPRSFWSAPRNMTSGQVQHRKSSIHGLPVTLHMPRVKSDKSDWFWSKSVVFTKPFKTGMSLDRARGHDS